jgi:hypothetical protein
VSEHGHSQNIPVPDIRLGSRLVGVQRWAGVIGALCLILCCAGYFATPKEFFHSYLFAYLYWVGFTLGGLGILLMNNTVGGRWGVTTRSFYIAATRTLSWMLLLILPFFLGMADIYPWADSYRLHHDPFLWHKRAYLNMPFFWIRVAVYFGIWLFWGFRIRRMSDQQDVNGDAGWPVRMRQFSAPGLLIFVMAATFAYIDWILSADPQFFSTIYGAMILIGDVLQSFALTIVVLIIASKDDRFGGRINSTLLHDLGNMMFAFTIFWTYLSVSQLIIVWPANLPQEIGWYLVRVRGGWKVIATMVALVMFLIPFLALLSQQRKQTPHRLIKVAIWLLVARIVDIFWIVQPTYRTTGFYVSWTDFAAFFGIGGVWLFLYLRYLRERPLLPLRDPRVMSPLPEAAV